MEGATQADAEGVGGYLTRDEELEKYSQHNLMGLLLKGEEGDDENLMKLPSVQSYWRQGRVYSTPGGTSYASSQNNGNYNTSMAMLTGAHYAKAL